VNDVIPVKSPRTIRLWPAIAIVALAWSILLVANALEIPANLKFMFLIFVPQIAAGLFFIWWLFFSGFSWRTRLAGVGLAALTFVMFKFLGHKSVRDFILIVWVVPTCLLTTILALILQVRSSGRLPNWFPAAGMLLGAIGWLGVRMDGVTGERGGEYAFRWAEIQEDRFLEELAQRKSAPAVTPAETAEPESTIVEWPGFRGPGGISLVAEKSLATDWKARPPVKRWEHLVGPGWSSFAAAGKRIITQEQRRDLEAVVCYDLSTGTELWSHTDPVRFEETVSGVGPRATPTIHEGRVYTFGGEGVLNCLDLKTGDKIWQRNLAKELEIKPPMWGYSSSPAVLGNSVIVFPQGKNGSSVVACELQTGKTNWQFGDELKAYSSPQVVKIADVPQVLVFAGQALASFDAAGTLLWQFDWKMGDATPTVQPQLVGEKQILMGAGDSGAKLIEVNFQDEKWTTREIWATKKLKPDFNDFVVHDGFVYGFDGRLLVCVDLKTGEQKWRGGRYGTGQLLLLAPQNQLLVVGDKGEIALVAAEPKAFREVERFQGIEGKTWNHPIVVGGQLLLRNSEEMACYDLLAK
jgi:outer membrane protein assembly factor BamB